MFIEQVYKYYLFQRQYIYFFAITKNHCKKKKKKVKTLCINKFVDMKRFFNDSIDADAKTMLQLKF